MPPIVASLLCWGFIFWLFRRDLRQKPNVTAALWIPFAWLVIGLSQPIAIWLTMFGLPVPGGSSVDGGTPVDACFQFGLIVAGLFVLGKRRVTLASFLQNNVWIAIFLAYCFLATFWSDYTFVALKRWVKDLGLPIMALIVLTEPEPLEAVTRLLQRCAYIVIPVSILFIKYYIQWGRSYDPWTGMQMVNGIAADKNFLGVDCLITGFLFTWHLLRLLQAPRALRDKSWREELLVCVGFLAMTWWLLLISGSRTPLGALVVGLLVMFLAGWRRINKEFIGVYLLGGILLIGALQMAFDVYGSALEVLGRQPTLSGRTVIWHELLQLKDINPVVGVGFESFWMGKQHELPDPWVAGQVEAHNGYLETYLTLGAVGVALLLGVLLAAYRGARAELLSNPDWGRFRLGFFAAAVIYNWTESGFRGLHPVMQMFYLVALNYPQAQREEANRAVETDDANEETALAGAVEPI